MPSLFDRLWNRRTEPEPEPGGLYSPPERGAPDPEPSDFNVGDVVVSAGREQSGAPAVADERRRPLAQSFVLPDGIDGTVKGVDKDLLFVAFGVNIDPRELGQEPGTEPEVGQVFKAPKEGVETPAGHLPRGTRLFFLGSPDPTTWRMRTMLHFSKEDFFNKQLPDKRKWGSRISYGRLNIAYALDEPLDVVTIRKRDQRTAMPKVWRVEDAGGRGPYWQQPEGPQQLGWTLLDIMNATYPAGRNPSPTYDFDTATKQRIQDGEVVFGFMQPEDAVAWFGEADLRDLKERGYDLVEVDADEVIPSKSRKQVVFTRQSMLNDAQPHGLGPAQRVAELLASGDNLRRIYELEYKLYLLSQADSSKGVRWSPERVEKRRERYRAELESRIKTESAFLADQFDDWLRAHAQYYMEEGEAETEEEAYQMTRRAFPEIAEAQRDLAAGRIRTPHELNEVIQIAHVNGRMADRIYTNGWDLLNELSNLDENILSDWRRTAMPARTGGRNLKKHGPLKQAQLISPSSLYQHRDGTIWFVTDAQPRQFDNQRDTTTFHFNPSRQEVDFFASRDDAIEAAKARDEYAIRAEVFQRLRVNEIGDHTVTAERMFIEYAPDENRTQLRGRPDEYYVMSGADFGYGLAKPRDISHVKKIYELELEVTKLKQQPQPPYQRIEKMEQRLERMLDTEIGHLKRFMELWRDYDIDREMHSMNVQRAISDMERAGTLGEKLAAFNFALNVAHTNGQMAEYMYGSGAPKLLTEFSRMAKRAQAASAQLVALHGLRAPALLHAAKTGGLVAPSIAITKLGQDFSRYGDIILVAPPELVDPADVPVYNADVYSPRYPNMRYAPDKRRLNKLYKDLDPYVKETEEYISDIDYFFDRGGAEELLNRASAALKLRFLREVKGIDVERVMVENRINPEWVKAPSWDAFMKSDYAAWKKANDELPVSERLKSPEYQRLSQAMAAAIREWAQSATDEPELQQYLEEAERKQYMSGDRASYGPLWRAFKAYQQIGGQSLDRGAFAERIDEAVEPHTEEFARWYGELTEGTVKHEYFYTPGGAKRKRTPENILKHLTHKTKGGEGFNYGLGSVRAQGAKKFRSWDQMLKASDQIVSHEEMEEVQEKLNERFFNLAERVEGGGDMRRLDGFAEAVREAYKRGRSLRRELELSGLSAGDETIRDIYQFMDELRTAPTEYFEAKPQRVVNLHEFMGAAVPEDVDPRVLEALQEENLRVVQYPEGGRAQAIAELASGHTRQAVRRTAIPKAPLGKRELSKWLGQDTSVTFISPFRADLTAKQNKRRMQQLRRDLHELGIGESDMRRLEGWYHEGGMDAPNREGSLMVRGLSFQDAQRLARAYDQDSIIFKSHEGSLAMYGPEWAIPGTPSFTPDPHTKARGQEFSLDFDWDRKLPVGEEPLDVETTQPKAPLEQAQATHAARAAARTGERRTVGRLHFVARPNEAAVPGAHRRRAHDEPAKGAFEWGGLPISIEHFVGDERWNGKVAPCMYGYFPDTLAIDGDAVDVLVGPDHKDDDCPVWVAEQLDPQGGGELRQYKTFIGFQDEDAVRECFLALWSEDMLGEIESCPADEYRDVWFRELDISRQEAYSHEHEEDGSVLEARSGQRGVLGDRHSAGRGRSYDRDLRRRSDRGRSDRRLQASGVRLLWPRPRRPQVPDGTVRLREDFFDLNPAQREKRVAGRLQDVKVKYPELAERGYIDQLSAGDPSGNNKYLPWMARMLDKQLEIAREYDRTFNEGNIEAIIETTQLFHKNLDRMEPSERDINQYNSITHADMVAERAAKKPTQKERRDRVKQGAEVVYRDDDVRIMRVKSHEASCFYGKGTKWCITQEDDPAYFDDYTKNAHMYFVIEVPGALHERRYNAVEQFEELLERLFYERRGSDAKFPNINSEIETAKAAQNPKELHQALAVAHMKINQATPNVDSAGSETFAALQDAKQTAIKSFPRKWAVNVSPNFQGGGLDYVIYNEEDDRISEDQFPYMDKIKELTTREDAPKLPRRKFFVTPYREPEEVLQVFEDEKAAQRWASDNRADVGYGVYSGLYLDGERLDDDPRWIEASRGESVPVVAFDGEQPHWAPKSELSSAEITDELLEEHNATSAKSGHVDGYQIHRSRTDMRVPRLAPGQPVLHSSLRQAAGVVNLQGYDEQLARMVLQGEAPARLRDVFPTGFLKNPEADARFRKIWFDVTEQPNAKVRAVFLKPSDEWDSGRIILNTANLPPNRQLQRIRTVLAHELRHAADWAYTGLRDDADKYRWTMQEGAEDDVQYVNNPSEMRSLAGDVADLLYGIYGHDVTQLKGVALVRSIREDAPYVWNNLEPENRRPFLQRVMKALEQRLEQAA